MILGGISMITMLAKIFIKNRPAKEQRQAYGTLCSIVGICLNVCLFAGKYFAGMLSGSVCHHSGCVQQPVRCRFLFYYTCRISLCRENSGFGAPVRTWEV